LSQASFLNEIVIFLILFASSIGIGVMADRSKSILYASYFHILGNICFLSSILIDNIDLKIRYFAVLIIIIINVIEFKKLKSKLKLENNNHSLTKAELE
jgi:membrane protease YdiL (CAAX protease family)